MCKCLAQELIQPWPPLIAFPFLIGFTISKAHIMLTPTKMYWKMQTTNHKNQILFHSDMSYTTK